jgi:hypothetical protein
MFERKRIWVGLMAAWLVFFHAAGTASACPA